jgi:threonine/homoserine/homoserine lactone efflux protein
MVFSSLFLLFAKGILIGCAIAAPVGPVGILCIRRTLSGRYGLGLMTGLGAGVADTVYSIIVGFSLVGIANFINQYDVYVRLFGSILVGWIGYSIFKAPLSYDTIESRQKETPFHCFVSAFFLTLSNPFTLIVYAAAFTALSISPAEDSFTQGVALVGGVFVGANGWWFSLNTAVRLMHRKISNTHLLWINRVSGIMLCGFSVYIALSLL